MMYEYNGAAFSKSMWRNPGTRTLLAACGSLLTGNRRVRRPIGSGPQPPQVQQPGVRAATEAGDGSTPPVFHCPLHAPVHWVFLAWHQSLLDDAAEVLSELQNTNVRQFTTKMVNFVLDKITSNNHWTSARSNWVHLLETKRLCVGSSRHKTLGLESRRRLSGRHVCVLLRLEHRWLRLTNVALSL